MYTAEQVQNMEASELVNLIEKKIGRPLPAEFALRFAMAMGATKAGQAVRVCQLGWGPDYDESVNWQAVCDLLNGS